MNPALQIRVYENQQLVHDTGELMGPVELGRQFKDEQGPYCLKNLEDRWRLVVARFDEDSISRRHLRAEALPGGKVRLTNLRDRLPIHLDNGTELKPLASLEGSLPYVLTVGKRMIRLSEQGMESLEVRSLSESAQPPGPMERDPALVPALTRPPVEVIEKRAVFQWLHDTMRVLQSATGSPDFLPEAVQAAVEHVGLDCCRVLMLDDQGGWRTQAIRTGPHGAMDASWHPSITVLSKVQRDKKTCWQVPRVSLQTARSLELIRAVVAAPILNSGGDVIGVLYGDRVAGSDSSTLPAITELQATLIELLASGVAAGLARQEHEKAAVTARVRFEQFFTPELSRQLSLNPDLLKGQDAEVTLLFSDIRRFSKHSERLGPAKTVEWVGDVMGALSYCVHAQKGVLVDYIGDELIAMWGAPEKQSGHASMACRAALQMLEVLPGLNERWQEQLKEPLEIGIGINTGKAWVGNTGSHFKFKYSPLGSAVNLASRVQGASKYLKTRVLVTGFTQAQLTSNFVVRRLSKVKVVNIQEPVQIFELVPPGTPNWPARRDGYALALEEFEAQNFNGAIKILGHMVTAFPEDGPSKVLLARALSLLDEPAEYEGVWELPGK